MLFLGAYLFKKNGSESGSGYLLEKEYSKSDYSNAEIKNASPRTNPDPSRDKLGPKKQLVLKNAIKTDSTPIDLSIKKKRESPFKKKALKETPEKKILEKPIRNGVLERDEIQAVMFEIRPLVKKCYEKTLADFPNASGKVVIAFEIKGDEDDVEGRVELAELESEKSDLRDEKLHDCLMLVISDITTDSPGSGEVLRVNYPFSFLTKAKE